MDRVDGLQSAFELFLASSAAVSVLGSVLVSLAVLMLAALFLAVAASTVIMALFDRSVLSSSAFVERDLGCFLWVT